MGRKQNEIKNEAITLMVNENIIKSLGKDTVKQLMSDSINSFDLNKEQLKLLKHMCIDTELELSDLISSIVVEVVSNEDLREEIVDRLNGYKQDSDDLEEDLITDEDVEEVNKTMEVVSKNVVKDNIIKNNIKTLVGLKFGSLLVKAQIPVGKGIAYEVVCDCGNDDMFSESDLINGKHTCCGLCEKKQKEIKEEKPQWLIDEQNAYFERLKKEREVKPIVEVVKGLEIGGEIDSLDTVSEDLEEVETIENTEVESKD